MKRIPRGYQIYRRCEACKFFEIESESGELYCVLFHIPIDVNAACDSHHLDIKKMDALIKKDVEERLDKVEKETVR